MVAWGVEGASFPAVAAWSRRGIGRSLQGEALACGFESAAGARRKGETVSRHNKVNPDHYKLAGRLTPDDLARERMRQTQRFEGRRRRQKRPVPPWMLPQSAQSGRPQAQEQGEESRTETAAAKEKQPMARAEADGRASATRRAAKARGTAASPKRKRPAARQRAAGKRATTGARKSAKTSRASGTSRARKTTRARSRKAPRTRSQKSPRTRSSAARRSSPQRAGKTAARSGRAKKSESARKARKTAKKAKKR